jgi:hypothetical protein
MKQSYKKTKQEVEDHITAAIDLLQEVYEELRCGDPEVIKSYLTNKKLDNPYQAMCLVQYYSEQAAAFKQALETEKYNFYGHNSDKYDLDWIEYEGGKQ